MNVKTTIDCYLSNLCMSKNSLMDNIQMALEIDTLHADVNFYRITDEEAAELGLKGSPSIVINGNVFQPIETDGFS